MPSSKRAREGSPVTVSRSRAGSSRSCTKRWPPGTSVASSCIHTVRPSPRRQRHSSAKDGSSAVKGAWWRSPATSSSRASRPANQPGSRPSVSASAALARTISPRALTSALGTPARSKASRYSSAGTSSRTSAIARPVSRPTARAPIVDVSRRNLAGRDSVARTSFAQAAPAPARLLDAQAVKQRVVGPPRPAHPHREIEVHRGPQLALELAPRGGPDRLDHPPAVPDEDALLRLGLDPDQRAQHGHVVARRLDVLDDDLDGVRHLLEGAP